MYPLEVVLCRCGEDLLFQLRRELVRQHAQVVAEFASIRDFLGSVRSVCEWTGTQSSRPKRHLFIIHLRSAKDLPDLNQLGSAVADDPILALVDPGGDPQFLTQVMRQGAVQVVLLPLQSDDFKAALERIGIQFGYSSHDTPVIAVTGATGGCGCTTVALNLAYEIAEGHQKATTLAELSFQLGVLPTYLNIAPQVTVLDLLHDVGRLGSYAVQKALTRVSDHLNVLVGPHQAIGAAAVAAGDVLQVIDCVRRMAKVVVLDVPCTYDDVFFHALAMADKTLLVGEQKVSSVRALSLLPRTLAREAGIGEQHVVLNRYDPKVRGFSAPELEKLLGVAKLWTVANDYVAVTRAQNEGRPLRLEAPHSRVLADIGSLARAVLGAEPQSRTAGRGVLGGLIGALGLR